MAAMSGKQKTWCYFSIIVYGRESFWTLELIVRNWGTLKPVELQTDIDKLCNEFNGLLICYATIFKHYIENSHQIIICNGAVCVFLSALCPLFGQNLNKFKLFITFTEQSICHFVAKVKTLCLLFYPSSYCGHKLCVVTSEVFLERRW